METAIIHWKNAFANQLVKALVLSAVMLQMAHAEQELIPEPSPPLTRSTTFVFENDIFTGQDNAYTNGMALLFAAGTFPEFTPDTVPGLVAKAIRGSWMSKPDGRERARVYSVKQAMQTPSDITIETLQTDQLPYAGVLLGELSLYAFNKHVSDRLSLTLGVVGPWSFAEESQTLIHQLTGSDEPAGWDNQLRNEVVFQVEANRGYRLTDGNLGEKLEVDLIGLGGLALGTLASHTSASLVARIGKKLERTFPVASLLSNRQTNVTVFSPTSSWYAFAGAELTYIANDIFVDGNTFEDSHSVKLDHTRQRLSVGLSFSTGRLGWTLVYADVPGNGQDDSFGAISVTYRH